MNRIPKSVAGQTLAKSALWIREAVPILNGRATDADCRQRRFLVDAVLAQREVEPGRRVWHTAQLIDGHIAGVWANSVEEAELELTVWWGHPCHWVRPDPGCRLHQEYHGFPTSIIRHRGPDVPTWPATTHPRSVRSGDVASGRPLIAIRRPSWVVMMATENEDPLARETEDVRLEIARAKRQLWDRAQAKKEARRQYARDYYATHREEYLEYQRQYRAEQREKDPDAYRAARRERNQRWRDKHKDEVNAKNRQKYRDDPDKHRQRRREFYADHAEEQRARRRDYYARNKDKQYASHKAWREREARRRAAGLPPERVHQTSREQRLANERAADDFFARRWGPEDLDAAVATLATPPDEWAAWKRDCLRARASHHLFTQREELARLRAELKRAKPGQAPRPSTSPAQVEVERQEAIGRQINDRLRYRDKPRRHPADHAAPHLLLRRDSPTEMDR